LRRPNYENRLRDLERIEHRRIDPVEALGTRVHAVELTRL
jgi:hypothetical protein